LHAAYTSAGIEFALHRCCIDMGYSSRCVASATGIFASRSIAWRSADDFACSGMLFFALAPAHYHEAFLARSRIRLVDDERRGRFEAMLWDFEGLSSELVSNESNAGR
jgi:hypothetical protein